MSSVARPRYRFSLSMPATPLSWDPTALLLSRFAFGPTVTELNFVHLHGVQGWWNQQLALAKGYPGYSGNAAVRAVGARSEQPRSTARAASISAT